ncbi:helix-turn-helix transcriptional regulator [Enterovibrio norvegicus]|uniref:helix-turn-helix transcriptional regulator n=1 Tax=Enterovibrio norvegicus TaxID=188144 RepID=UPI0010BEA8C3|nr:helix-turn-helix transcriptional regulator [Enterovibrio norvegicus]TKF29246.1 helix-turn-helix transcriptional regulator [Enterovibrio norvegicus]
MEPQYEQKLKEHLRHVVKQARLDNKLSQVECAQKMEIARQTYMNFESGETLPKIDLLYDFAELTKRPLSYFLPPLGISLNGHILIREETWEKMTKLNEELRSCLER